MPQVNNVFAVAKPWQKTSRMLWLLGAFGLIALLAVMLREIDRARDRKQLAGISRAKRIASKGRLDEAASILRSSLRPHLHPRSLTPILELVDDLCAGAGIEVPEDVRSLQALIHSQRRPTPQQLAPLHAFLDRSWPDVPLEEAVEPERAIAFARSEELEAAIAAHPGEPAQYVVYADWLSERGDPRGELIALHHRMQSDRASRIPLRQAEQVLLDSHEEHLLPLPKKDLGKHQIEIEWYCGYLRRASFYLCPPALVERLLAHPSSMFLRELEIRDVTPETELELDHALSIAVRSPLRCLERLRIEPLDLQMSWTRLLEIESLSPRFPHLRWLRIGAGEMRFGRIHFPELDTLIVATGSLRRENIGAITAADWPSLEHLELWFGDQQYGADCGVVEVIALLLSERFPRLIHLGLKNAEFTDALCAVLHELPILSRVRRLDLSMGTMSDEGARSLAEHRDAYRHLEQIDLSDNFVGAEGVELVRDLCRNVVAEPQRDEEVRYPIVGE